MEQFYIVLNQIGIFLLLLAAGFAAVRTDILDTASLGRISRLIMNILLPSYIFINTVEGATREGLAQSLLVIPLTVLLYVLLWLLGLLLQRLFRVGGDRGRVFRAIQMFGNVGFMGIPLVVRLYPDTALLYIALFTILDQTLFWTYGVSLTEPAGREKKPFSLRGLRKLLSPALLAILLGTLLVLLDWHLPAVVTSAFARLGDASMPLSLLYIGGMLSMTDVRRVLRCTELYAGVAVKMLLLPLLFCFVLRRLGVPRDMAGTMAFIAGLPSINLVAMLAKNNGSDGDYAVCAVMLTTIACLLTLPLVSLGVGLIG